MKVLIFNIYFLSYSLPKKDGNTKKRVEDWKANVRNMKDSNKKQVDLLERVQNGESKAAGGGNYGKRDYFSMLITRL